MPQVTCKSAFAPPRRVVLEAAAVGAPGVRLLGYNRNHAATTEILPHRHDGCFELVYVVSGEICFEADGLCHTLHGGDLFLTQPGQPHSTGARPTSVCEFYWLQLDAACENLLCLQPAAAAALSHSLAGVPQNVLYGVTRWEKPLAALLKRLCAPLADESPLPQGVSTASTLLPMLCDAVSRGGKQRVCTPDIEAALRYIQQNIESELPLTTLARQALLSVPRLKTKFSQQVGMPPRAYVNAAKIEAAKALLRTGASVTDTAFRLSFSSSGYFSLQFRKFTGQPPSLYAAQARGLCACALPAGQEAVCSS